MQRIGVRPLALVFALAFVILAARPLSAPAVEVELLPVGSPAPAFSSEDTEGQPFELGEALEQGPVMIVFWSLFCGSCMEELPIIEQEKPKFEGKVQVLTVNLDEAPRARNVKAVAKQKGFTFRMLLNKLERKAEDGSLVKKEFRIDEAYKVKATPAIYLVNRDGTIAFGHSGPLNPEELNAAVAKVR